MPKRPEHAIDPKRLDHLFSRTIDATPVHFVRPVDTDRPSWAAYQHHQYLGTLHAQPDSDSWWHVQSTRERHTHLDDAVRALRRPATWPSERERVRQWVNALLADPRLLVLDVQTTSLATAWAVQIGMTDRHGNTLFDEIINPLADITPAAAALHGITPEHAATAPTFSALLPTITHIVRGRRCLAYNLDFDRGVLERELRRHHHSDAQAQQWLRTCSWEDAMAPCATWTGLWAAHRHAYRYQPLRGPYNAVANCRTLLTTLRQIGSQNRLPSPR
ncbi:3'-5' exonuclease [Streptomyces sp. NPDC051773]|uniref:3'-5' exonuclease n=1 Tax=Streptomyces sp. NPDC051773 TaxID=3156682 RepID=UPI00342EE535